MIKYMRRINILEHELVPKHRVLSPEEAKDVLKKLGCSSPADLPWISASDPVVKAIKAKPGDIIEIIRKSPTAGSSVFYRYVVIDLEGGEESEEAGEEEESGEEEG
ncbi:MAG: DNA-directed RNA polymerase subunit H [Desulfurococcaceae archaeon]|uniref:DNA-directed RNA polymerase subunit Rpo5 n=1 Tax=Staphylothermus marinus TaxID=2280 RepID=A0A7C4NNI0_STAMA